MADGTAYNPDTPVLALPRQTAATQVRHAIAQTEALLENLRRGAEHLAAERWADAARCAEDANRRATELSGVTAVVRAQCSRLEHAFPKKGD